MREVASRQRHQCHHLRRDDLRWLLWGWQGLLPGRLRGTPHDRNRGSMDPDWYCVCGLQLCQAGSTRYLPPSVTYLRLGIVLSQQLGTAYPLLPTRGWQTHPTRKHASYRAVIQRLKELAVSLDVITLPTFPTKLSTRLVGIVSLCVYMATKMNSAKKVRSSFSFLITQIYIRFQLICNFKLLESRVLMCRSLKSGRKMVNHPKQNCLQTLQIKLSYVVVEYVVAQGFQFFSCRSVKQSVTFGGFKDL